MKDYIELNCKMKDGDHAFIAIGTKLSIEVIEDNMSSSIVLDRNDIEKILPLMLAYYYNLNMYERLD